MKIYNRIIDIPEGFRKCKVVPKECYNNNFRFAVDNRRMFNNHNIKIAYGFINMPNITDNLWIRHCFLLYNDNEIIDITINDINDKQYIIFKTFNNADELLELNEYHKDTSLSKTLVKDEMSAVYPFLEPNMQKMLKNCKHSQDFLLLNI